MHTIGLVQYDYEQTSVINALPTLFYFLHYFTRTAAQLYTDYYVYFSTYYNPQWALF
jgi:hypothetical protein